MTVHEENIAQKIHTYIDVLHGKLRLLESYLTDREDFKYDVPASKDAVKNAIVIGGDFTIRANNFEGLLRLIRTGRLDINGVACTESDSLDLELCIDCVDRIEEIVKKIK